MSDFEVIKIWCVEEHIFDVIEAGSFPAEEAVEVDIKLSKVEAIDIPSIQVKSIMDYINLSLLCAVVFPACQGGLQSHLR